MKRKVPYDRDERDVRATIACAMRVYVKKTGRPIRPLARELRWHTSASDSWLGPTEASAGSIDHVWLMKGRSRIDHAKGFLRALYRPGSTTKEALDLVEMEVGAAYPGDDAERGFLKAKTPRKRKPAKPTMGKKLATLTKNIAAHEAELKTIERRTRFLKKKLRSERAQLRAGHNALTTAAPEDTRGLSDADLLRLLQASGRD